MGRETRASARGRGSVAELASPLVLVWGLFALESAAIVATYWRLPARELYHVSESGLAGGAGRALGFLNFPTALVAIAVLFVLLGRLAGRLRLLAWVALALCAVVMLPGVVDERDLDARSVNLVPALGVLLAIGLTTAAPVGRPGPQRGDRVRLLLAAVLVAVSLPWIFADLGILIGRIPVLGALFNSTKLWAPLGEAHLHHAVHPGHHHGEDGLLLALTALLLSRTPVPGRLGSVLAGYLSLMLAYGVFNVANDGWLEQVVKRRWTSWAVPSVLTPAPTPAWGVLLAVAALLYLTVGRRLGVSVEAAAPMRAPTAVLGAWVLLLVGVGGWAALRGEPEGRTTAPPAEVAFAMTDKAYDVFALRDGVAKNLTAEDGRDLAPAWSPDGARIAFQSDRDGNPDVWVMSADGSGLRQLTTSGAAEGEPAWSPDGKQIAYVRDWQIWVMGAEGRDQLQLTSGRGEHEWPAWSHDGELIAFDADPDGDFDLFVVGAGGGAVERIVAGSGDQRYVAWSADGHRLAYESDETGDYDLYVRDASGTRRVTRSPGGDFAPTWSPDGRSLLFFSERAGRSELYLTDIAGRRAVRLTASDRDKDTPRFRPR